jgi:hypothetical protein
VVRDLPATFEVGHQLIRIVVYENIHTLNL